jgi:hypothetical protein
MNAIVPTVLPGLVNKKSSVAAVIAGNPPPSATGEKLRQTKIEGLGNALLGHKKICGFNVPMNDAPSMCCPQSIGKLRVLRLIHHSHPAVDKVDGNRSFAESRGHALHTSEEFEYKLRPGTYFLEAQFSGRGLTQPEANLDVKGLALMPYWTGSITSNRLQFEFSGQ